MAMKTNPSVTSPAQAAASFISSSKQITHLGAYIEPTSGKLVDVHYDQTNHAVNVDTTLGQAAPIVLFSKYSDYYSGKYGRNLIRLGAFQSSQGVAQGWYDPIANITLFDTVTV